MMRACPCVLPITVHRTAAILPAVMVNCRDISADATFAVPQLFDVLNILRVVLYMVPS